MIKNIRLQFIALTVAVLFSLLLAILITINSFMVYQTNRRIDDFLHSMIENEGKMLPTPDRIQPPTEQPPAPNIPIKGFSVKFDVKGELLPFNLNKADIDQETALFYAEEVFKKGKSEGKIDSYRYKTKSTPSGTLIVFADQTTQDMMLIELQNLSFIIGSISMIVLVIITVLLSKFIVKPVNIAFEKQKRFVADSGHELKTPLAIISANIDILEMEIQNNKYISEIKNQSHRMNHLIRELLVLARTENQTNKNHFTDFNLSDVIENTALPFEVLAFEQEKEIALDIETGVHYHGDENNIKKMLSALIDNAVKYSTKNSKVMISLKTKGNKKIIQIQNTVAGTLPDDSEKLFDRFYRIDESRARNTGGFGIGLSIVKSIVEQHGGKITTEYLPDNQIAFKIALYNKTLPPQQTKTI